MLLEMTSEERLAVRIWVQGQPRLTYKTFGDGFKQAAESFHALSLTTQDEAAKSDLIMLRNIATYRAANP